MKVVLPLNGGINKDKSPLYIDAEKGEVIHRKNCRVTSTYGSREGINTSIKGMTLLTAGAPSAHLFKQIGFVEDKEREQAFYFTYSVAGNHSIHRVKGTDITSLNADYAVLNFQPNEIIDADIIGDFLIFTSDYNPPRKIRIAEDGADLDLFDKDKYDIQLAVRPPSSAPTIAIGSDTTKKVNKLDGKTFQFATMYIYDDYTYSVLSPYSELVVSWTLFSSYDNTTLDSAIIGNYVNVTYDLGTDSVSSVRLLAREGNSGSWFVVDTYDKSGNVEYELTTFTFDNNVARVGLTESQALNIYSDVPRLARNVKVVQNRVGLANVLKGYDKVDVGFSLSVEYEDVSAVGGATALNSGSGIVDVSDLYSAFYIGFDLPVSYAVGDVISVAINNVRYIQYSGSDIYDIKISYHASYPVQAGDTDASIIAWFMNDIDTNGNNEIVDYGDSTVRVGFDYTVSGVSAEIPYDIGIGLFNVWAQAGGQTAILTDGSYHVSTNVGVFTVDVVPTGVRTFKSGSYYNVGIVFYDEFSRTSGVLGSQQVYIPHNGERNYANAFDRAKIAYSLDLTIAPSWAKYWRFAITESVNFAGVYPFVVGNETGGNAYEIFLDGKNVMAVSMPTNFQYEFAKGDYLLLEDDNGVDTVTTISKSIIGTRTTIDVLGVETAGFWLIVPKGTQAVSDYAGKLCSIYREKSEVAELVYFEDSETYDITGGIMQTPTGYVGGEDAWFIQRRFEYNNGTGTTTVDKLVEDFYINIDSAIRSYSKGRVLGELDDTLGEIRLQDFVWSFNYLDNTKINGISTFNSLNRVQLDEKDGEINGLKLSGFVLKVIQDNKETSLYIGKSEVSGADGNLQLVKSNNFVGTVRPMESDYGSRYQQSIVQNDRDLYYWDGDRACVVRSSANGQIPISDYGMKSEFLRIAESVPTKVIAGFDRKNNEYFITFTISGVAETWSFKEGANVWNIELDYTNASGVPPDIYGNIGTQVYCAYNNFVFTHETNSIHNLFLGDYKPLSITGVVNVSPREEKRLDAIEIDSNRAYDTIITSPITNTNAVGQKSILNKETYRNRDGSFTSAVFKNILQVGGAENLSLLHSGTDMVGKYLEITFTDDTNTEAQIRLVTVGVGINK